MFARAHKYPVQVLRSPEARPRELQLVGFGLDEAFASPATPSAPRLLRSFTLPPSPPYTTSHPAIPLPLLDENALRDKSPESMESEKDGERRMLFAEHGPSSLLSPPYSPRRRSLSLLPVNEKEEELGPSSSAVITNDDVDEFGWRESDNFGDESEPPILKLKDLDLGEESDDWDEPLFLNNPSEPDSSDGLALNLFGAVYSSDDEGPSSQTLIPPSSPNVRSRFLPDFDLDPQEKSKPLFDPSDFDVFDNEWDSVTSDSTQSSLLLRDDASQDTVFSPSRDQSTGFQEPSFLPAPTSPSRRSFVDLPSDHPEPSMTESWIDTQAFNIRNDGTVDQLSVHSCYPSLFQRRSRKRQLFNVPAEVTQTPFNIPLHLPSSNYHSPPANSLLFSPLDPQDIPLPGSPQSPAHTLQGDYAAPSPLMLEESRIRRLLQAMIEAESEARAKEVLLTQYIARLNAMPPPSPPLPVPVYCPVPQTGMVTLDFAEEDKELEPLHLEEQPSSSSTCAPSSQSYALNQGTMLFEFLQVRRQEVQNAVMLRAAERRHRKLMKERIREVDALLQLKTGPFRSSDAWASAAPRGRRGRNDDTVVLAASGSDRYLAHANALVLEGTCEHETSRCERRDGIMQLVAKMVFRRRDISRPLSGKSIPLSPREYVRSRLSRSIYSDESESDDENPNEPDIGTS